MLARKYYSEIKSIENSIEGIYTLEFISLERPYKFCPGQFLHIAIDNEYDGIGQWPESRCFSMQSNPNEKTLKITYAVKGRFTKLMEQILKVGSKVWLKLPFGELFTQIHNKTNTVFIAGGTGVTPYLSLFTNVSFQEYVNPRIYLGFKSEAYNIYKNELTDICNKNTKIKIFYENKEGLIDINKVYDECGHESSYFISGPPVMIKIFKNKLSELGVIAINILTDDWE